MCWPLGAGQGSTGHDGIFAWTPEVSSGWYCVQYLKPLSKRTITKSLGDHHADGMSNFGTLIVRRFDGVMVRWLDVVIVWWFYRLS